MDRDRIKGTVTGCSAQVFMAEPVHSIADFLAVIRKSGLVEEDRLAAAVAPWTDTAADLPDELPAALVAAELLTDWQVEQLRKGKHKGFMLGKYRLLRLLGAGGMSSVYLAENTTLKRPVAIKVLPVKRVEQSSFLARFEREAHAAFRLGHQNLARVHDLDTAGTIHFIVMEYIDGTDLHAKVKQEGPLAIRDAVDYLQQAALGLHYAHEEGLVHRDIKPANLILDRKGTVKILDMGLALASEEDNDKAASLTREHDEKVLGTADYLAPEQATDSHLADRRSDIYALGCTLHYLLVGRAPFAKGKLAERIQAHAKKPAPNIIEARPDVPPAIAELYFRMMEKHPDARPQTAAEVADAFGAWLKSSGATERAGPPAPPRRGPPRRGGTAAPAPVFRHGPGSGSSSSVSLGPATRPPAANLPGSGSLVFTSPPAGGRKQSPPGRPAAGQPKPAGRGPKAVAGEAAEEEADRKPRRRRPIQFAGVPLGAWIALAAGLIAVAVLGTLVYLRLG
jgi:serine/threonine protein kinase